MIRIPAKTRDAVWERDSERCFRCGVILHRSRGGHSIHHRQTTGMGGTKTRPKMSQLILLCGSGTTLCHGWVTGNPQAAEAQGYLVSRSANAAARKVLLWQRYYVLLGDDGSVTPLA